MKMTRISIFPVAAIALGMTLSLGGCVNVLPKVKPVQLYRFGYQPELAGKKADAAPPSTSKPIGLILGNITYPPASAGDQVLTVDGNEVAYIGQVRWASSASSLFSAAVSEGFARSGGTVELEPRGPSAAIYRLDLSVRRMEVSYTRNHPTVSIGVDARILRLTDRAVMGERYVSADVAVRHNDMSLIADAYNQATTQVVTGLIDFADNTLVNAPPPAPPASGQ